MPKLVTFLTLMAVALIAVLVVLVIKVNRSIAEAGRLPPGRKPSSNGNEVVVQAILNAELQTLPQADAGRYDDQPVHHDTSTGVDYHHTPHYDGGSFDSGLGSGGHHSH